MYYYTNLYYDLLLIVSVKGTRKCFNVVVMCVPAGIDGN